ncbi:MAG: hypothetical protein H6622_08550 [Halobacteriovoraceae bacterium]|nr:hypothetical protein [Halobacteriovoraceae bacterium]
MNQYLYFLTIPGNESFLKSELAIKYPNWNFSYSRKGFCTFKNFGEQFPIDELARKEIIYATTYGETLKRIKLSELNEMIESIGEEFHINFFQLDELQTLSPWYANDKKRNPNSNIQFDFIRTQFDEIFVGKRLLDKWKSPINRSFHVFRDDLISRAYYKAADAFSLVGKIRPSEVLELGCVPGGISQYLLENRFKVFGVDPGKMNAQILENKDFHFFNLSVQEYKQDSNNNIEILISDMNLNPKFVLKECIRISKYLKKLKWVFITIKTTNASMLEDLELYRSLLKKIGCTEIDFLQLPYHRKEFLALGKI